MAEVNVETAKNLGLTAEEFEKIIEIMGREPNFNELSIYSVMWSEHCSYKNSIKYLKTLTKRRQEITCSSRGGECRFGGHR
jgi:phosphoribosylformylglycinamidine (FGAM) synthase-like enzyme